MSFIHVEDCARKICHLAEIGVAGNIFNLYTQTTTQKEFVKILSELLNIQIRSIPLWWLQFRFEKAVREAFSFSLNMHTMHQKEFQNFRNKYPDLKVGLSSVIRGF
jgi:nucleoside-diphosphate-sugar epimerase